jgi:hydrogenase maturation protease
MSETKAVIIGLGNPLMADDGLGIEVLNQLRPFEFHPDVELVDGGTWGMNLLPIIEDHDHILLIDAINTGAAPGTLIVLERDEIPRYLSTKVSPHQVDLRDVLALAEFRGKLPQHTVAIGLQPEVVEMRTGLSPSVKHQLGKLEMAVFSRLAAWGLHGRPSKAFVHA